MAYSSVAQLRTNVPRLTVAVMSDVLVGEIIDAADDIVEVDLSGVVDFSLVTDTPAGAPTYINYLSQYKTAERCLVAKFSSKRMDVQMTDWEYWQLEYDKLLEDIISGEVALGAPGISTMRFNAHAKEGVTPALGTGEYGEHLNNDDREDQVAKYGESDQ